MKLDLRAQRACVERSDTQSESRITAHIAYRVTGDPVTSVIGSSSLRSDDASLVCVLNLGLTVNLTGVRRVQFALLGRTANLTAVPSGSIGSAHPLG